MPGLFQTLEIGKRALLSHQITLQTIGHNIANVNTPGYTRQRVGIVASLPEWSGVGILGSGVEVSSVRHIRDLFLGQQFREDSKSLGQWEYRSKILVEIESLISEPNDNGLSQVLNKFWDSWSDLSTNSNSVSSRAAILEQGNLLVNSFHDLAGQLTNLQSSIDRDLVGYVGEINRLTTEIARINEQVATLEHGGTYANDLRDNRDFLIDQLSQYIDVNTREDDNGQARVYIGAMALVDGSDAMALDAELFSDAGQLKHRLNWKGSSIKVVNLNGQLKGLMDARDKIIPDYLEQLDTMARTIVREVNLLHRSGFGLDGVGGRDFFDTTNPSALGIELASEIRGDVSLIAASASGEEGDNTIALAIHDLRLQAVLHDGSTTINEYYNGMVGRLGIESREAQSFTDNYMLLLEQIEQSRQSVQGVSLDEEMTNLIRSQHAYDAAARVITVMDQALDTVILGMGVVGRM